MNFAVEEAHISTSVKRNSIYTTNKLTFAQKEITRQTDLYIVILSSKTFVFENILTKC